MPISTEVANIMPTSVNDVLPWSFFDKLTAFTGLPHIPLIGHSMIQHKSYTAWHIAPESVNPHTQKHRMLKAILENDINEVKILLDKGFDADRALELKYGCTALTLAAWFNRTAIMKYLICRGAHIDCLDGHGNTALMLAVKNVNYASINLLIAYGANIAIKDKFGFDCIDKAKFRGFDSLKGFLEKKLQEREEIIEKATKIGRKKAWDLPKYEIKFGFEEILFRDETFDNMIKNKKFYKTKASTYPFNDFKGSYFVSFLQEEQ